MPRFCIKKHPTILGARVAHPQVRAVDMNVIGHEATRTVGRSHLKSVGWLPVTTESFLHESKRLKATRQLFPITTSSVQIVHYIQNSTGRTA